VFPVSDKAVDIISALVRYCERTGVTVRKGRAEAVVASNGSVSAVVTARDKYACRAAVVCTGGASYPVTGSTGDGYKIAAALGHRINPPKPSLVPLRAEPGLCSRLQGLTLKNIGLKVFDVTGTGGRKKPLYEDFGELLFTHFGVSGPLVLSASAHMRDYDHKAYELVIDLKPALDEKALDARLLRDFEKYANRNFANALEDLAPRTLIPVLVELSEIPPETKVNAITRAQRLKLLSLFKSFRLKVDGPRPIEEAIITSGGVDLRDINPTTMESKLIKGLYFAGEVIDCDAYTGGFNLQIAWCTAYAAARHIPTDTDL
jgi:predicted Rossmann fold flavoprotein